LRIFIDLPLAVNNRDPLIKITTLDLNNAYISRLGAAVDHLLVKMLPDYEQCCSYG